MENAVGKEIASMAKQHSQSNEHQHDNRTQDQANLRIAENLIELEPRSSARNETSTEQDEDL